MKQIILISICVFISCSHQDTGKSIVKNFKIPFIIQPKLKGGYTFFKNDNIETSTNAILFLGKFKFCDTIRMYDGPSPRKNWFDEDFYYWGTPYSNSYNIFGSDTLPSDGFQLFIDYNTTINFDYWSFESSYLTRGKKYFPLFLVNETSLPKAFIGKQSIVYGTQEIQDTSFWHYWRPIEYRGKEKLDYYFWDNNEFCGTGKYGLKVNPDEFIVMLVPKFDGNFKIPMRVRLKVGENIYISRQYIGTIDRVIL